MSYRSVPLQAVAMKALEQLPVGDGNDLVFPAPEGGSFDLHNFRNRYGKAARTEAGIRPVRRVYDLRHTFATFALRAGVPMLDVSRFMGTSLSMIDRHYGHLARDCKPHSIKPLDDFRDQH
jgi:integrase